MNQALNKHLFNLAFFLGATAIVWIGIGFFGSDVLALSMTAIIGAVYAFGALELHRFRQISATLAAALEAIPAQLNDLSDWLHRVPASLQTPVRLRIEGERIGLPGPALTPYLVGLLVMLGMLGTFLGMVVTLKGAVFALEGTTDLQAIRSAMAAPIKGLGLAFGTSVAGVAASSMLGLMSALSRRERMLGAQLLDTHIATTLRGFSLTYQRQATFKTLQLQSQALPQVVDQMQAMMAQMERMGQQINARLLSNQEGFHRDVKGVYTDLAHAVDKTLRESLTDSARLAGEGLQPAMQAAIAGIAQQAESMHAQMAQTFEQHASALVATLQTQWQQSSTQAQTNTQSTLGEIARLIDTAAQAPRAAAEVIEQLRHQMTSSSVRDNELLAERSRLVETLNTLLTTVGSETAKMSDIAAHVTSSAVEVSSLSDAFGLAVQSFGQSNDKLIVNLQRIEGALAKSQERSDDQLAYYVAQAREIIELSISSQPALVKEAQ
jgi:hypothetical protein